MRRLVQIIILLSISVCSFGQRNYLRLEINRNLDLWKPYSDVSKKYQDSTGNISSNTWGLSIQSDIINKPKWSISAGIGFKKINYIVKDRIHVYSYQYKKFVSGSWYYYSVTEIYDDPADLIIASNNFGLNIETQYYILKKTKYNMSIGIRPEIYFLEFYDSYYSSPDIEQSIYTENSVPQTEPGPEENFYLTNINANLFYRITWYSNNILSLGAKVNVGMNLYSDWEDFKRYGYVGIGFELGFGQFKP